MIEKTLTKKIEAQGLKLAKALRISFSILQILFRINASKLSDKLRVRILKCTRIHQIDIALIQFHPHLQCMVVLRIALIFLGFLALLIYPAGGVFDVIFQTDGNQPSKNY